ncbi:hypothetical protein AAHA92_23709 [Salvia divinorum]|uniref:Uncharacterized protein n=1 Tax=Salvia divinorum TaxID=28513 RepID=A0ABD1GSZ1_SALDI
MENPNFKIGETALGESDTDSGVCGKRKRGEIQEIEKIDSGGEIAKIDSGGCGGEIAKIDSGGCGGEIAKIDPGGGSAMAEEKKTRHMIKEQPYDREEMLKYISQVRNSFGLDVDVRIPCRVAVDEINADMKSKTYELVEVAKASESLIEKWLEGEIMHNARATCIAHQQHLTPEWVACGRVLAWHPTG